MKKMKRVFQIIWSIFVVLSFVACSSSKPVYQPPPRPSWCDNPPQTFGEDHVFVALSEAYGTESEARVSAKKMAAKHVLDYVGTEIEAKTEELVASAGSSEEGLSTIASIKSYIRQNTEGLVKRLTPVKWHREILPSKDIQVCVMTTISPKAIKESIQEAQEKIRKQRETVLNETKKLFQAARSMEQKGSILEALKTLNSAKIRIEVTKVTSKTINLSTIEILETNIINKTELEPVSPLLIKQESIQNQSLLELKISYASQMEIFLTGFPIVFSYANKKQSAVTNNQGLASYLFKSSVEKEDHSIVARFDINSIKKGISSNALEGLKAKQLTFQIKIKLEKILFRPLKADFNFRVWTENNQQTQPMNQKFKVKYSCYTKRCYLKLFGFEQDGPIIVVKDLGNTRMLVDQVKSFNLQGDSKGKLTMFGITSSEPFPISFKRGKQIKRSDFRGILKTLRESPGEKAEFELVNTIQ
jgi:hypothetical protein